MTGSVEEPRDPLIGRGRSGGEPPAATVPGAGPGPASGTGEARPIPRPQLEPAGRLGAAWTPARLRLGLGVALVAALAVAWFALSSRSTPAGVATPPPITTTAPATTAPATPVTPIAVVPSWVPRAIASTCRARASNATSERVVVDCAPGGGIATLRYRELTTAPALTAAYDGARAADRRGAGPSRCASGRTDERAWSDDGTPTVIAGRYRCTRPHGVARIEWTDDATRVLAIATRADGDLRSLYAWWAAVPGPVASRR